MLFLKLDCGRNVKLEEFTYSRTYASLLEGRPDAELNARILEYANTEQPKSWGSVAMHLIPPVIDVRNSDHPVLPPVLLRALLTSFEPIDPAFTGSALVVVWLTEECHAEPIAEVVVRMLKGLAWDKLASDFDY
jgi:hypothetical protein